MSDENIPDYEHWCKIDEWSFKDAALLLKGLDPLNFMKVRFNMSEAPETSELKEAYLIFLILKTFKQWEQRNRTAADPLDIFYIAIQKKLPIPEKLEQYLLERREQQEEQQEQPKHQISSAEIARLTETGENQIDKDISARERRNFLKAIGIFIAILADVPKYAPQFFINNRVNAYQVTQLLLEKAGMLKIDTQGIKSLNRKIKEALDVLAEDRLEPLKQNDFFIK